MIHRGGRLEILGEQQGAKCSAHCTRWMMKFWGPLIAQTTARGAATTCYVATSPEIHGVSGEFFESCRRRIFPAKHPLNDDDMAATLWKISEELVLPNG
jgi:hypothetical protein